MDQPIAVLQQLGFGEYEARAYAALVQRSPLNGYEVAKASGVPRANVYAVLHKLEERGAVVRLDSPEGAHYAPVAPAELTARLGSRFEVTLATARSALEAMTTPPQDEYVWNTRGEAVLLDHARALISAARERLLVAIRPPEANALADDLARAEARGVQITTLCFEACPHECGGCRGQIHRYRVAPEERAAWLVLVLDDAEMLAAEIDGSGEARAVRTRQRLLVNLTSWYIRHSIALAALVSELGSRLDQALSPSARAVLASVGPGGRSGGWLEYMRSLLNRGARQPDT